MCTISDQEYKNMIHTLVVPANLSNKDKEKRYEPLFNYLKKYTPNKLFRFRSCKERTFKEFDQDMLGFAPSSEMNDDFDGMLYFDKERIKAKITETLTIQKVNEIIEAIREEGIPDEIKKFFPENVFQQTLNAVSGASTETLKYELNQFKGFVTEYYDIRMALISQITQNQKIACLSQRVESATMWGYYAYNGTGFALSYDLREVDFSQYCLVPVIYGDERLDATEFATWLFLNQTFQRFLLSNNEPILHLGFQNPIPCPDEFMCTKALIHKASSWEHEKEWRLVYYDKNTENQKYPYILKKPSAVYLGRNISSIDEKILRHIAVEKNIPVYKMMICEDNPSYSLVPQLL